MTEFGRKLNEILKTMGMDGRGTAQLMSRETGLGHTSTWRWIQGLKTPHMTNVVKIVKWVNDKRKEYQLKPITPKDLL